MVLVKLCWYSGICAVVLAQWCWYRGDGTVVLVVTVISIVVLLALMFGSVYDGVSAVALLVLVQCYWYSGFTAAILVQWYGWCWHSGVYGESYGDCGVTSSGVGSVVLLQWC